MVRLRAELKASKDAEARQTADCRESQIREATPSWCSGRDCRKRFDELIAALVELTVSPHSDEAIRDLVLDALMAFVKLGKDGRFQSAIYHKLTLCYFTYTSLDKTTSSIGNKTTGSEKNELHSGHNGSEDSFAHSSWAGFISAAPTARRSSPPTGPASDPHRHTLTTRSRFRRNRWRVCRISPPPQGPSAAVCRCHACPCPLSSKSTVPQPRPSSHHRLLQHMPVHRRHARHPALKSPAQGRADPYRQQTANPEC
ncbi:hypothetical protein GUJ93_ZPchr0014g47668 [Zizania palustris]|uniref:Uncharacterized protein n=1 Tax=Zizania palustris TaxID=103762 RepID=A0A8J5SXV7_ZIZPA|nr:hypothetical protein GUJ93_ZPchr0014g47668 [Zizania palustris]